MADKTVKAASAKPAKAAPAVKLLETLPLIEAAMVSINRRGQTLQHDIHVLACSVLKQIGLHSDVRLAAKLLLAMPEASRKNAMRDWLCAFGPITFDGDNPVFVTGGKVKLGDAMKSPFWSFSPEKPYVAMDVAAAIASLIKKLTKDQAAVEGVDHTLVIAGLEKLAATPAPTAH